MKHNWRLLPSLGLKAVVILLLVAILLAGIPVSQALAWIRHAEILHLSHSGSGHLARHKRLLSLEPSR
jgi:hypothetical protein